MKVIVIVLLAILVMDLTSLWLQSEGTTTVALTPEVKTIGEDTPVEVTITNPHGVRRVTVWIEQGRSSFQVFEKEWPAHRWRWKNGQAPTHVRFEAGKEKTPGLQEGKARLVVEAVGDDFRAATGKNKYDVNVVLAHSGVVSSDAGH